jgi:hypothetical protein
MKYDVVSFGVARELNLMRGKAGASPAATINNKNHMANYTIISDM